MSQTFGDGVECTRCHAPLTFANVIYLLMDTIVCICPCLPKAKATIGLEHPRFAQVREKLLGPAFANVLIPYTAAEYPPFALPGSAQHEQHLMRLAMLRVFTPREFERECEAERAASEERRVPDSSDGEGL